MEKISGGTWPPTEVTWVGTLCQCGGLPAAAATAVPPPAQADPAPQAPLAADPVALFQEVFKLLLGARQA